MKYHIRIINVCMYDKHYGFFNKMNIISSIYAGTQMAALGHPLSSFPI